MVVSWWVALSAALLWAAGAPREDTAGAGSLGTFRRLLHHALSLAPERAPRAPVQVDPSGLALGDVIVASHPHSAYGYFSHVTAVIGPGETLGHHIGYGIFLRPLQELDGYDDVRVLRAEIRPAERASIARFLRSLLGRKFNLLVNKHDPRSWNCAKSIWVAYARTGLDLVPDRDYIVPDDIARSPLLHQVGAWRPR